MGNTLRSHEDLVHVRGWSSEQIGSVFETLRRKRSVYFLTREEFSRYFGGRNREALTVFSDLDTDCDGRVDIFEVFVVLTIWSGTSWEEKLGLLFDLFDMMGKGFLRLDEFVLMGTVMVQALSKFIDLDDGERLEDRAAILGLAKAALARNESNVTKDRFQHWARTNELWGKLEGFVKDHAARVNEDAKASRMRMRIGALERHASRLFERVRQLQDRLPDFSDACVEYVSAWGRRKRWDFLMQNMRHLVLKLQRLSDSMHTSLADLEALLNEDAVSGGMASVVDPERRFSQEQMIISLDTMRERSSGDFREAVDLLKRLIELTEPGEMQAVMDADRPRGSELNVITEDDAERDQQGNPLGMAPPRVIDSRRVMEQVHADMLAETEGDGCFARLAIADSPTQPSAAAERGLGIMDDPWSNASRELAITDVSPSGTLRSNEPTLVAIADFEPPPSHQTQMLQLSVGDQVTVLGQDGRGWWYGRKQTGKEGWFPPCYVQLKPAHYSTMGR
mmetsp:Transcript_27516/g.86746  ORF Transcript_27516/g.86746 Transcript_27516/m.86746 type:complete len:507 (-) Transcript_27516:24-1544(-)